MLKIRTKFKLIIAFYAALPMAVMMAYAGDTPLFHNPDFQGALGVSLAVCILVIFCSPILLGLKWLFLRQLIHVKTVCQDIKHGKYTLFTVPNEPSDAGDDNEMASLMRDMNWMIRQIQFRETELEDQVARRTHALEEANADLVKARDAADASARAKSEFLTTMSHEIRTPMNAIINLSGLALKKNPDPSQKEYLEIIHSSSSALLGIINDILDFSKMDAGKLVLEAIPLNLRNLFEEITDMFKSHIADSPVELILDIDPAVPGTILGDPLRLRQVLTNLISNAVKFTRQGEILVRVAVRQKEENRVVLNFSVRDSGVGIEKDALETLFTPFTQEDGSTTREFGGTGLGLAISQKLVGLMGGEISAESRKGDGACFFFDLAVEWEPSADGKTALLPGPLRGKAVRVIVRNANLEQTLINYLGAFGLTAIGRGTNASVNGCPFSRLRSGSGPAPAVVLLDADMDQAVLDSVVDQVNDIPVIALGRASLKENRPRPEWAAGFIPKPVKQSMLFDTLMEIASTRAPVIGRTSAETAPSRTLNILVVEDNRINQTVAREVFRSAGIDPVIASSGQQAVDLIETRDFHAVIMDVQMPEMDGYQATRIIREKGYDALPVIAMTANAMADDRQKGLEAGMTAYITKPVDPDSLFSTLESCLGIRISQPEPAGGSGMPNPGAPAKAFSEDLPGFDLEDAMNRLNGDLDLFKQLIKDFYRDNKDVVTHLTDLMADRTALAGELHRLKGTCATLSVPALHRAVVEFEALAKDAAFDPASPDVRSCMSRIQSEMERVAATARSLDLEEDRPAGNKSHEVPEDIMEKMSELGRLIDQNSLSAKASSKNLAAELSGTPLAAQAGRLESQVKRFEFSKARQTFQDLYSELQSNTAKSA